MTMINPLIRYLKNPEYIYNPYKLNYLSSVGIIGKSLLVYLGFILVSSVIVILPIQLFDLAPAQDIKNLPLTFKILVFVPLYEELIFRLPLRFSPKNIFISIGTFVCLLLNKVSSIYIGLGIGLIIASIPFFMLPYLNLFKHIQYLYLKHYKTIFYIFFLGFGMVHLTNYVLTDLYHFLIAPLLVVNQVFMGLLLGFVRVQYKYGFLYSFIIHSSHCCPLKIN